MKTALFDFPFDDTLIATSPLEDRQQARLMVVRDDHTEHKHIYDLCAYFQSGDVIVLNNTKVIKARIQGHITSEGRTASCFVTLHKLMAQSQTQVTYSCFVKNSKKLRQGDHILFSAPTNSAVNNAPDQIKASVSHKDSHGQVHITFETDLSHFFAFLDKAGSMPLPPYIEKHRKADSSDDTNYQTIFAQHLGSVAAPTASLHFTPQILDALKNKGVHIAYVTLHVGGGTFLPVKTESITDHTMHSEIIDIDADNANIINQAKRNNGRIICVGTTALRVVESVADTQGILSAYTGETDIFIYPSYQFKACDILMTNFHLPKSTLFMLVCAFSGTETMQSAYQQAQALNYRFFSYGDACLLFRSSLSL